MRHAVVQRVFLALCALFVAASLLFAWRDDAGSAPAESGAALFDRHCAGCHDAADLAEGLRRADDRDAAARRMIELLDSHGATDARADRAIVDELLRAASA